MKSQRTTQIVLPTGEVIEVIYVSDDSHDLAAEVATVDVESERTGDLPLHLCPECKGDFVYPVSWEEAPRDRWTIERRCPSCEWCATGDYEQDRVDAFDDVLTSGTEEMLRSLREVAAAGMADDVERLVMAIQTGLIEPMDF